MCQYSSEDGFASDWHLVHLGSRAVGGAALVMMEATAVEARGRISPADQGIWKDEHVAISARIAGFLREQGAVRRNSTGACGAQGQHAASLGGRRRDRGSEGGWQPVAPSAVPFPPGRSSLRPG